VFDSVKKPFKSVERAGVPVDIIHLTICRGKNFVFWSGMKEVLGPDRNARRRA